MESASLAGDARRHIHAQLHTTNTPYKCGPGLEYKNSVMQTPSAFILRQGSDHKCNLCIHIHTYT
ncbi:hypothetical protein BD777DRAFT_121694 [Yarrowia lipolytica]|nr:hypothetical protein BD777DRAFT_121694 [Yarrowia lipolytica]